jgi:hypothetical protein
MPPNLPKTFSICGVMICHEVPFSRRNRCLFLRAIRQCSWIKLLEVRDELIKRSIHPMMGGDAHRIYLQDHLYVHPPVTLRRVTEQQVMRYGPPAPSHDIAMPCVRVFIGGMHMLATRRRFVISRIVWVIGRSRLGLEQISQFRFGCGLGPPTTIRQSEPKFRLVQERPLQAHEVCKTARWVFRLAGKAGHPDVLPRIIRVARRMECCPILVFAGAESNTPSFKIWCAARLAKLEVGRGFDCGDDVGIHRLLAQRRSRGFQESSRAWGSTESSSAVIGKRL